jgi:hypothetical protein
MEKEVPLSEQLASFPFCDLHNRAPEGQRKRSPSFAYIFLAKQEK